MIRPFDWRDLPLLHRVRGRGLCLAAQLAYTRGPQALAGVIVDAFSGGRSPATLVVRDQTAARGPGGPSGIGQLDHRPGQPHARLAFFAPVELMDLASGTELLEALARSAGERGAQNLIAEVEEHNPAFEQLRRAGFSIYARQRIWRADPPETAGARPSAAVEPGESLWRAESPADILPIRNLALNLVPSLVQQIEPLIERQGGGMVHGSDEELLAYLEIERGPLGVWIQPYLHPAVEYAEQLLSSFLAAAVDPRRRPVYACVRSYQSWMNGALDRLGFLPEADQAVMVRRLAVPLRETAPLVERALAAARAEPGPAGFAKSGDRSSGVGGR